MPDPGELTRFGGIGSIAQAILPLGRAVYELWTSKKLCFYCRQMHKH